MIAPRLDLEYDAGLVEAAVLASVTRRREERAFRHQRDRLYEVTDGDARDERFGELHARWFVRLGLEAPFRTALGEQSGIARACARCVVARARSAREEGADLRVAPPAPPTLLVLVRAETVSDPPRLTDFLRRELLHVADMLDPGFGYVPHLGHAGAGPSARVVADRYRALWDAFVDGRLVRRGHLHATVRAERLREVERAFPELGALTGATFERFFGADRCTHAEIAAIAGRASAASCPLCWLPTTAFEASPHRLPAAALEAIAADFPAWRPDDGICGRCAELYRHRGRSAPAA